MKQKMQGQILLIHHWKIQLNGSRIIKPSQVQFENGRLIRGAYFEPSQTEI